MSDFFEFEPISEEKRELDTLDRKNQNSSQKTYVNDDVLIQTTEEELFNFEENKKKLIDNLNWLHTLSVEEFTFYKKYEEIRNVPQYIKNINDQVKPRIWEPKDIFDEKSTIDEINSLKPKVIVANNDLERLWNALRLYCHTGEFNQSPGRFLRFLMIDEITDKVLGFSSIASDVISISDRDEYIGWTLDDRVKHRMMRYSAIGSTIAPTQPFGYNFLGGKLMASMLTSEVIRNEWENQSEGVSNRCKLVGMTTTSLYGSYSMYNGLRHWHACGKSKGKIPIQPNEKIYKLWHDYIKRFKKEEYSKKITQDKGISGPVTGVKMQIISMIFKECGIKQSDYCHGFFRGIYRSHFYENTKEFLCRKIQEKDLVMKPLFKAGSEEVIRWWKLKAIGRYKKLKLENRLKPNKLFYNEMEHMTYEEAKNKFFQEVGR